MVIAHGHARLFEDLPAERRSLVDEEHGEAEAPRLDRGGEPRGPAADDEEVVAGQGAQRQRGMGGSSVPTVRW